MDVNSRQELPVQLGPVYFQYAVDRIICSRRETDSQSKAIQCVGVYTVICRLAAEDTEITQSKLAERIGMTYPGLNRPLEYLKHLRLVSTTLCKVPGTQINVHCMQVPRPVVEVFRRNLKRAATLAPNEELLEYGIPIPEPWHDVVGTILDHRGVCHTAAKALKALGLIPFMARLSADGLPVTRPVLSRKLGIAENTLAPLIKFLEAANLIEVEERRIPGHIGTEHAIHFPPAIVDHVRRAVRRLEKEDCVRDWPNSEHYRSLARVMHQSLAQDYGHRAMSQLRP